MEVFVQNLSAFIIRSKPADNVGKLAVLEAYFGALFAQCPATALYILNCRLKPKLESHNMGQNVHAGKASEVHV